MNLKGTSSEKKYEGSKKKTTYTDRRQEKRNEKNKEQKNTQHDTGASFEEGNEKLENFIN